MSAGNGIIRNSDGSFSALVGGQVVGGSSGTQQQAENSYNANGGPANFGDPPSGGGGGGGSSPTYGTQNGQLTLAQMLAGLDSAAGGYWSGNRGDPTAVQAAFQGAANAGTGGTGFNLGQAQLAQQQVEQAGTLAYQYAVLNGATMPMAQAALQQAQTAKAQELWNETSGAANLSGTYQGQPTLAARTQSDQNAVSVGQLTGTYGGAPTLAATTQQEANAIAAGNLTGTYNGAPTLAAQQQQQTTALDYLNLLKGLQGPANAFQYAQTLNGTPGGLRDIVASAYGRYQLPSFGGGNGQAPVAQSLNGLVGAATSGTIPGGGTNPANSGTPLYGNAATANGVASLQGSSGGQASSQAVPQYQLPAPNQISPQAWNAQDPSQRALFLAAYANQGYDPADVTAQYQASLPTDTGRFTPKYGQVGIF